MSSTHRSSSGSSTYTQTTNALSFLRIPKSAGFGAKAKMGKGKGDNKDAGDEEEWYIPYKGPYEPAPAVTARSKKRVSWGDSVVDSRHTGEKLKRGDGVDLHLQGGTASVDDRHSGRSDQQHHVRNHASPAATTTMNAAPAGHGALLFPTSAATQGTQRPSSSQSLPSIQNQKHQPLSLRPDYSSPRIATYINLDAAGGIGDSPVPHRHPSSSSSSSVRHMQQHIRFGIGGGMSGRPSSAREAREGNEGGQRTLRQRSSLASLFEKKYTLLKKLTKLGLGPAATASEGGTREAVSGQLAVPPEKGEQPLSLTTFQSRLQSQSQSRSPQPRSQPQQSQPNPSDPSPQLAIPSTSSIPSSPSSPQSSSKVKPHLRINPPRPPPSASSVFTDDDDHGNNDDSTGDRRHDLDGDHRGNQTRAATEGGANSDIIVEHRSEAETRSLSVYSQPSAFMQPKNCKEAHERQRVDRIDEQQQQQRQQPPRLRLTPPPGPNLPMATLSPLSASTMSSFDRNQRTLSSPDSSYSQSHSRPGSRAAQPLSIGAFGSSRPTSSVYDTNAVMDIVAEDDSHVESYYDMLITSGVPPSSPVDQLNDNNLTTSTTTTARATSPPVESRPTTKDTNNSGQSESTERHPYAHPGVTFPSGYINPAGKKRLSPIPQSQISIVPLRNTASTPDLRIVRGGEQGVVGGGGGDEPPLRPNVREKLPSAGGGIKERWLSTDLIAIFLPKPKFRIKATKMKKEKEKSGLLNRRLSRSLTDLVTGGGGDNMAEFGVRSEAEQALNQSSLNRRKSYSFDDLSLLSLDRVLEERDRLERDRIQWQAQAVNSLGNKQARFVSRARSKSLTQAGRRMLPPGQPQQNYSHYTQSSIDYLAARACLGDQDIIPLVNDKYDTVGDFPTPTPTYATKINRKPQFEFPRLERDRHERKGSGSSGFATSSGGRRSSNSNRPSYSDHNGRHKRNDSWSRSAVKIARSVPQLCGVVQNESDEDVDVVSNNSNSYRRAPNELHPQQQQQQRDTASSPDVPLKNDPPPAPPLHTSPAPLLNPVTSNNIKDEQRTSPCPSNTSTECPLVGIAISTPTEQEPATYNDYRHHPYTIGADRIDESSKEKGDEKDDENESLLPVIRLPDHPYAQGGLSSSGAISRSGSSSVGGGEREFDYVGPHPATAAAMSKELMANLGLSELSARHRLPPHVTFAPPLSRHNSGSQQSHSPSVQLHPPQAQQKPKLGDQLYVKVDDIRNSYQDLQPYVRVDSDAPPSDRLWVTYSPGTVREVMPSEVFQYSPRISNQDIAHVAVPAPAPDSTSDGTTGVPSSGAASIGGVSTDLFLQRYQRMSTVYQDTASMSQVLANAMYDSSVQQDMRRRSIDSGIGTSEGHQQFTTREPVTTTTYGVLDLPETIAERTDTSHSHDQLFPLPHPPRTRMLFGPRTPATKQPAPNLSLARVSSPTLPHPSPSPPHPAESHHQRSPFVTVTSPFPGESPAAAAERAPPALSISREPSSGTCTSPTSPTVPRVGSPDNLEPFHGLFYRPPEGSETDSLSSPSPPAVHISGADDGEEEDGYPPQSLEDVHWSPRFGGSGLTTLMKDMNAELEQMVLERQQREEERGRSGSIRSSNTQLSQRPSTSESYSTSTTSKGGTTSGGHGTRIRSRRINTEAGPLDFVLDRSAPQHDQDLPMTQSGYIPRPNRLSAFYPATPIPEDIEFSRASSPFEGTVEDETARLSGQNSSNQTGLSSYATPLESYQSNDEEFLALYPEGARASYHTADTISRISTLSDFPVPPHGITPEEISILASQHPR